MVSKRNEPFGAVAVRLGFATPKQVAKALKIQQGLKQQRKKHKLIGLIMLEMDVLDTTQLIAVLKEMEAQRSSHSKLLSNDKS